MLPRTFVRLATGRVRSDQYARALHEIERRTLQRKTAPAYDSKASEVRRPPSTQVDPWSVDPATIEQQRVVCQCPDCLGEKRVNCNACEGTTRARCAQCAGGGRVHGQRGKNCPSCRGTGERKCSECRGGLAPCVTCDKIGRVEAWLTLTREVRRVVCTGGAAAGIGVHGAFNQPDNFDAPSVWPADCVDDRTGPSLELPGALAPALDPTTDRIRRSRIQVFATRVGRVELPTLLGTAVLEVSGREPAVGHVQDSTLRYRRWLSVAAGLGVFAGGFIILRQYETQHEWFAKEGATGVMFPLSVVAAVAACFGVLGLTLGRRGWSVIGTWVPLSLAASLLTASAVVSTIVVPTAHAALARYESGDVDGARREADAALMYAEQESAAGAVIDRIRLDAVRSSADVHYVERLIDERSWFDAEQRRAAEESLKSLLRADVETSVAARDARELRAIRPRLEALAPDLLPNVDAHVIALEMAECAASQSWSCVATLTAEAQHANVPAELWESTREAAARALRSVITSEMESASAALSADTRVATLQSATDHASTLAAFAPASVEPVDSQAIARRLERAQRDVAHEAELAARELARLQAEEARLAAAEQRRAEAEARRVQREQERARRAPPRRSCAVQCCDGTCSPSCAYVHSGCCSHHGGVC